MQKSTKQALFFLQFSKKTKVHSPNSNHKPMWLRSPLLSFCGIVCIGLCYGAVCSVGTFFRQRLKRNVSKRLITAHFHPYMKALQILCCAYVQFQPCVIIQI